MYNIYNMEKKLKAVGIIAEYNPFHNGHKYHLEQSLKESGADVCVSVISGNFTQRGEIALLSKWTRAEMAVKNGVNLVVEMPVIFACNSAGYFAESGIEILEALGAEFISFGSELGNINRLISISRAMKDNEEIIENSIKKSVKGGLSYPRARHEALINIIGITDESAIENPNNILALEYLKYIKKAKPITVKRQGAGYYEDDEESYLASATAIRKKLIAGKDISPSVPDITWEILRQNSENLTCNEMLFDLMREKILTSSNEEINMIFGAEEGLGNAMKNGVRYWKSYDEMVEYLKSKRYTRTRVLRVMTSTLLGITRENVRSAQNYVRVLAFDEKGSAYLKQIKKDGICHLPIITNINKDLVDCTMAAATLEKDILATDIYNLAAGLDLYMNSEYVKKPLKL